MILALDTSTAACTAALFDAGGALVDSRDEVIGRGHAERLVPMIEDLLQGRTAEVILVGCGPGSFTGLRVGIAAAQGLAIGWSAELHGMSSLALLAAAAPGTGPVATAVNGGHGELFVQEFNRDPSGVSGPLMNLPPQRAATAIQTHLVVGSGARALVEARGYGEAIDLLPSASVAMAVPDHLRSLRPQPAYARAPDARPRAAA
ncbi:tRNA (adenosine(37)-N6)-threonylcarbamoyltransferase complex dimerization subunit type 1 TsaB [Sphingomonas arenae]|uniref:tRNA (adenosine(37)-N6)-threonylcarbamoyltransferase complex dimerization subunit type 1 TsaB n=1 Tax=Sphingomonas arenae TaxID=2812555 RepID=UPI0019671A09|nr:tRNA (adenosine(37)-N6)-threonylcarbamoyltransferase complex dimerization subunit type 1 TsaB [Sphingomonas arenae]